MVLHDVSYYRELDELKGRFVSTVSHELRTPLSSVILQVSTLLKYYDRFEESERRDMILEVEQQAQVLRDLIEDILELSRFDAKRSTPQKRWFDLAEQCRGVVTAMRHATDEKLLTVDMGGCASRCHLLADPHQLERVARNLFSNAVKYTPVGGSVAVRLAQVGNEIKLEVEDTGIGIAPEEQGYVFDRFFRSELGLPHGFRHRAGAGDHQRNSRAARGPDRAAQHTGKGEYLRRDAARWQSGGRDGSAGK